MKEVSLEKQASGDKKSILDKLEFLTDKKTMLSVGAVVSGVFCLLLGYWLTVPFCIAGAVFFSPQMRKKHPSKEMLFSIIGSVLLCLGFFAFKLQDAVMEEPEEESAYSDTYYGPTTNEERYGNGGGL